MVSRFGSTLYRGGGVGQGGGGWVGEGGSFRRGVDRKVVVVVVSRFGSTLYQGL